MTARPQAVVTRIAAAAFTIPTASPESDGTLAWDRTTLVVAETHAAGERGFGYTYSAPAAVSVIADGLAPRVLGRDAMDVEGAWWATREAARNFGAIGIGSSAIAALDTALWDLKARLLGVPLLGLLGAVRERIAAYGSGGFTSYTVEQLQNQLAEWAAQGLRRVKMKVGRAPHADGVRVRAAREAIGESVSLFVDANGAYDRKQALRMASEFGDAGVGWFEEPVSSDDLTGLRVLRDRAPAGMDVAAGEYGYETTYFRRMLEAQAVDVLQADATRCGGVSGFLRAAALAEAFHVPLSAHTAPALHAPLCCAAHAACHVEYFFDHVRIESMLFDGGARLDDGCLVPDPGRPGLGVEFRSEDAERFRVAGPLIAEAGGVASLKAYAR